MSDDSSPATTKPSFIDGLSLRAKIIAIAAAVVILAGAIFGITAATNAVAANNHAAKVQAAKDRAEKRAEDAAADRAEEKREAEAALQRARENAVAAARDAQTTLTESAPWAIPETLTSLQEAAASLDVAVKKDDAVAISDGVKAVRDAIVQVGTKEYVDDTKYVTARTAAGHPPTAAGTGALVQSGRAFCTSIIGADVTAQAISLADHISSFDQQAIDIYCPQLAPAVGVAANVVRYNGGYAVAGAASPFGTEPQVLAAGTYRTTGTPTDCYYETNNQQGTILANNFVLSAPGGLTVTLRAGQGFTTQGCGSWIRQ